MSVKRFELVPEDPYVHLTEDYREDGSLAEGEAAQRLYDVLDKIRVLQLRGYITLGDTVSKEIYEALQEARGN